MRDFKRESCPPSIERESRLQRDRKGLFDAIEKIGKLEVLNQVGGGRIRETLEVIASTSNSFRIGNTAIGALGTAAFSTVDNGAFAILDGMGLGEGIRTAVNSFQPQAVNLAVGSAQVLAQDIRQGKFTLQDIPNRVQDFQNLEQLASGIFTSNPGDQMSENYEKFDCLPSPFAVDLVQNYAPKQNFSFFVEIRLTAPYKNLAAYENVQDHLAFMVKSSSRPQVNYEYEEVNYYNFRSRVIQKQMYQPISMRFIDDTLNYAARFYDLYTKAMSPLNNISTIENSPVNEAGLESSGMNFNQGGQHHLPQSGNSASTGPLLPSNVNDYSTEHIIESISLYHIGSSGNTITSYDMFYPKITSLTPSDLTMEETGNGSEFTIDFEYDRLFVQPAIPIGDFGINRIRQLTGDGEVGGVGATYPLYPTINGNINQDGSVSTERQGPPRPNPNDFEAFTTPVNVNRNFDLVPFNPNA